MYLIAVGGARLCGAKVIHKARAAAFEDLGMEAIHEFEVEDTPVTVAVDANGESAHKAGPGERHAKIGKIPVTEA